MSTLQNSSGRRAGGRPATGRMPQFQLRLPAEWLPVLDEIAKRQGMTRSGLVRWIVGRYLEAAKLEPRN